VEQGGGIAEASWPPRLIPTPPAITIELAADVARCQQRSGGGGDNRGLKAYQAVLPNRQPLHRRRSEPLGRREVGRGKLPRPHGLPGCNSRLAATTSERLTLRRPL
jgi:hypothetical protein